MKGHPFKLIITQRISVNKQGYTNVREKKKCLTIIDQFNKFAQIYYLKNLSCAPIIDKIIHDANTEFNNNLVKELLNLHVTCVSNPKSNVIVEKFHCKIIDHLRIINQRS